MARKSKQEESIEASFKNEIKDINLVSINNTIRNVELDSETYHFLIQNGWKHLGA